MKNIIELLITAHVNSSYRQPIETTNNKMKVTKDKFLELIIMKHFPIHHYVQFYINIWFRSSVSMCLQICWLWYRGKVQHANLFLFPGFGMFIKIRYYVEHIFYGWTMSHNTAQSPKWQNCLRSPQPSLRLSSYIAYSILESVLSRKRYLPKFLN